MSLLRPRLPSRRSASRSGARRAMPPAFRLIVAAALVAEALAHPAIAAGNSSAAASATASAVSSPDQAEAPPVTIVGTAPLPGLGIDRDLLPYEVQTASSDDVTRSLSFNLTDFMDRNLTGVNTNNIQGNPFQTDVTFRGFRASSILGTPQGLSVYLDGVRVNEPFGDVVNWDMLPEAAIAETTLVPGSNPVYGLNTLGGALAFTTKSGLTHPGFTADLSYGSNNRQRLDLGYGWRGSDGWHAFAAGTLFAENGWRDHSPSDLGNGFFKIGRTLGATSWDLTYLGGSSRLLGNGLVPSYRWADGRLQNGLYEDSRSAVYSYPDETRNRLNQVAFNVSHWLDDKTQLAGMVYSRSSRRSGTNGDVNDEYADYVEDCENGFNANGTPKKPAKCPYTRAQGAALNNAVLNDTQASQDSYGATVNLFKETRDHHLTLGAAYDASRSSYYRYEQLGWFTADRGVVADPTSPRTMEAGVRGHAENVAVYGADTWALLPGTHLTLSGRWNQARVTNTLLDPNGGDQPRESFTYRKFNPAIGLAQKVGGGVTLFTSASQSNRVPTVIELGCADPTQPCRLPVGLQSDPYLKQVVSRTVEAGFRWQPSADAYLSMSVYQTLNHDDILFMNATASQMGYFANFDRTRYQGVDLSARKRIGDVTLRLNYSHLEATYDATGTINAGERTIQVKPGMQMAGLPRETIKLGADWAATGKFTVGMDMVAYSRRVTAGNEDGLRADPVPGKAPKVADWGIPGYALFNLRLSYRPEKATEFYAGVYNLFDRRYETFGLLAQDVFPNGQLLKPHVNAQDSGEARFVAPGAPRSYVVGVRYRFM